MIGYSGIPFTIKNNTAQPWVHLNHVKSSKNVPSERKPEPRQACGGPTPDSPSTWWYSAITHNGESSFMESSYKGNYKVFRNVVTDFGADNTGNSDASAAIQRAINGEGTFTLASSCCKKMDC